MPLTRPGRPVLPPQGELATTLPPVRSGPPWLIPPVPGSGREEGKPHPF